MFGVALDEVATTLEREPSACRKLATRAREHVRDSRPRYNVSAERSAQLAHAFYVASRAGDVSALSELLAEDVVVYSDGGGKRSAATKPVAGISRVERALSQELASKDGYLPAPFYQPLQIDGLAGFITVSRDGGPQTAFRLGDRERQDRGDLHGAQSRQAGTRPAVVMSCSAS